MAEPYTQNGHSPEAHHIVPIKDYLIIYSILVVLLILTVAASSWNLGALNNLVAMLIAVAKATMVVLVFMNVRNSSRLTWLWVGVGVLVLIVLFGTVTDFATRDWNPVTGWKQ